MRHARIAFLILLGIAASATAQISDPYGQCLPNVNPATRGQCIPNPYWRPDIEIAYVDTLGAYRQGAVYESSPAISDALLGVQRELAELEAARNAERDERIAGALHQEDARAKLRAAISTDAPAVLSHKDAWPAWHQAWRSQVLPLVGTAIKLADGFDEATCAKYAEQWQRVNLPPTPADDFTINNLARSLGSIQTACKQRGRFALMGAVDQARVDFADLAGRVYWRSVLYTYLDAPPAAKP